MKNLFTLFLPFLFTTFAARVDAQTQFSCGVDDRHLPDSTVRLMGQLPQLMAQQRARKAAGERYTCRVAVEIDSDTYLKFEKDTARISNYVLNQIERASAIFEWEINTQLVVVRIHVWKDTEPDPYRGESNIFNLFNRFSNAWSNQFKDVAYDKRIYLFTKAVTGAAGVGGGVQAISVMDQFTIAHEFGHCFGSPHTHSCSWPGGPIDYCSPTEGDCYSASLQAIQGTLMSYCIPNRMLSLHPLCQALMQNYAARNFALLAKPDKAPVLPAQLTLAGTPFLYWNGQPQAGRYDVEIAADANFTQSVIRDTSAVNGYDMSRLTSAQTYHVRVRAVNSFGQSDWSGVCQIQRAMASSIPSPVLLSPTPDQRLIPFNSGRRQFSVQPVAGATAYQLQVATSYDPFFESSYFSVTQEQPSFTVNLSNTGTQFWRVRAMVGGQPGPWSVVGRFVVMNNMAVTFPFPKDRPTPLTFPYSFNTTLNTSTIQATLATDSLFIKPVYTDTFRNNYNFTGMLRNLMPNTRYYLRIEEQNTRDPNQLTGVLARIVETFQTGSTALSPAWSFINNVTDPNWPHGYAYGNPTPADDAVWLVTANGLTRISQDSLTVRLYDRTKTNGKVGNVNALVSTEETNRIWVSNRISKGDFYVTHLQAGKFNAQTGELTEQTTFKAGNKYLTGITGNPRLYYTGEAIYEQKADSLSLVYRPANRYITRTLFRPGITWFILYNPLNSGSNELVQFNTLTRTARTFSAENTPQLLRYINQITVDGLGNLWVSQSGPTYGYAPLARFDGQTWTSYGRSSVPFSYAYNLTSDPFGNLFVINTDAFPYTLYKYDGFNWKNLGEIPFIYGGTMTADNRGNLWFNGQHGLLRYSTCAAVAKPKLTATKQTLEIGESVTLQAAGCSDVLWSWTSETETVSNRLVRGTNQLVVKPDVNTTYRSRCYSEGCSGTDTTLSLTVLPKLSLISTNKAAYCPGDLLTVGYGLLGKVTTTNQFSVVLKVGSRTTTLPATARESGLSVVLPAALTPGRYVLYAEARQPAVRTRDSVQVEVIALPTAELSSNKLTFSPGDSARIAVTLTGASPWRFTNWDGQVVQTSSSPYTFGLRATQPTNYSLALTALSDANCSTGIIKNALVVSALALASEPIAAGGVSVYPNPTTGRLTIEVTPATAPIALLRLNDSQGKEVKRKIPVGRMRQSEWDISALPGGQYILRVETTDGKAANWKVVKQ